MSRITLEQAAGPAAIADLRARLHELVENLWAAKRPEELLDTVQELEKLRSTLDAVELMAVNEIDRSAAEQVEGWSSAKQYVEAVAGDFDGSGGRAVRLATALTGDYRAVLADLADGHLSRVKADVIVRAVKRLPVKRKVRDEAIAVMLELARELSASELKAAGKHLREVLDADGVEADDERKLDEHERAAHLERYLSIIDDGMGGVKIKGRATSEAGAIIRKALMSLSAPVTTEAGACGGPNVCQEHGCAHDGKDPRDHGARMIDALVEGCRRLMSADVLPTSHGITPRLTLTMDYADLRDGLGTASLDTGESLSAAAVRRLACDCELIPMVLGSQSEILDVGRAQRLVTLPIWTALVTRDIHCAFPGCHAPPIACDAHHIVHWLAGGVTSLDNLVLLCRRHHTIIHTSPWEVRMNPLDKRPEFLPPARLDRMRRPIRRRRPRRE